MESTNRTQINPWISIWCSPKKTLRALLEKDPKRVILWLAIVSGVISAFSWLGYLWLYKPSHPEYQTALFIIGTVVVGVIAGLIHLYFGGWLYRLTGSWLGGKGTFTEVKCAIGWSFYPFIIAGIFGLISMLAFPNPWLQSTFGLLNVIVAIWGFVILMNLIGEAHSFSAWKAVLAFLIAVVLLCVALMLVSLLVPLLRPLFD